MATTSLRFNRSPETPFHSSTHTSVSTNVDPLQPGMQTVAIRSTSLQMRWAGSEVQVRFAEMASVSRRAARGRR